MQKNSLKYENYFNMLKNNYYIVYFGWALTALISILKIDLGISSFIEKIFFVLQFPALLATLLLIFREFLIYSQYKLLSNKYVIIYFITKVILFSTFYFLVQLNTPDSYPKIIGNVTDVAFTLNGLPISWNIFPVYTLFLLMAIETIIRNKGKEKSNNPFLFSLLIDTNRITGISQNLNEEKTCDTINIEYEDISAPRFLLNFRKFYLRQNEVIRSLIFSFFLVSPFIYPITLIPIFIFSILYVYYFINIKNTTMQKSLIVPMIIFYIGFFTYLYWTADIILIG